MTGSNDQAWLAQLKSALPEDAAVSKLREVLRRAVSASLQRKGLLNQQDVEDCVQDATLRALNSLDSFRGESKLATWVRAIGVHVALTYVRRRRAPALSLDSLGPVVRSNEPSPEQRTARDELIDALHKGINSDLTELQRTAIQAMLAGVPLVVLAERLGSNPNALYKLYHDARKRLRASLAQSGYSEAEVRNLIDKETSQRG